MTRRCHSEPSRRAAALNRLRWLVVNLFCWREIDRRKIALSDFTLHSLQLFFHSSTLRHAWDRQRLYPLAVGLAGGWADWGGMEEEMGVGRQSYIWALWGKINHVIISEKYGWISSAGSCPVHAAGFLTGLSLWLASSMTLKSEKGDHFENTLIRESGQYFQGYTFPLSPAATLWETSSGLPWQSGNRFTIWFCAKPALGCFVRKCFSTIFHLQQIWWSVIKGSGTMPLKIYFFIIFPIISQGHSWALKAS